MRRWFSSRRFAAASAVFLAVAILTPSLTLAGASSPPARHFAVQPLARTGALTVHDHTVLMQSVLENLPALLVTEAAAGNLISTSYSGILTGSSSSTPIWPPLWLCQSYWCPWDPIVFLSTIKTAPFETKSARSTASAALSALQQSAGTQVSQQDQGEILKIENDLGQATSQKDFLTILNGEASKYTDLKNGIAQSAAIFRDGESTIYNTAWLNKLPSGWNVGKPVKMVLRNFKLPKWLKIAIIDVCGGLAGSATIVGTVAGAVGASLAASDL